MAWANVTTADNATKLSINLDLIESVQDNGDGTCTLWTANGSGGYIVRESREEVLSAIKERLN